MATVATGVVAIATIVNWFFGGTHAFPRWFSYVLTLFVTFALYKYSEVHVRKLARFLTLRRYIRRQRFRLVEMIQGFGDLISTSQENSLTSVLTRISEKSGHELVDRDLFSYPQQILSNILFRLSDAGGRVSIGEFKGVLNDLSTLIRFCGYFSFTKPVRENRIAGMNSEDRSSLELARENFADFVRRFQAFHDEVQLRLGTELRTRLDIPKPL